MSKGNTWIGTPTLTSEQALYGGKRYYYQVPFCKDGKRGTKKFYYEPVFDKAKEEAKRAADSFVTKKSTELGI